MPNNNELKKESTREGFGQGLLELGAKNENVVVLTADLCGSTKTKAFSEKYPERFFEMGIAEANMFSVAAGLASAGKISFAATFGVFAAGRSLDQIRVGICYSNLNVKIGATHCGLHTGEDGASHQALEDIAIMRTLPNMTVIAPCDAIEAKKATLAAASLIGPVYLRLGRNKVPIITNEDSRFEIGKAEVMREGRDAAIIACGNHVQLSLAAAEELEKKNHLKVRVINCHTIKPIDRQVIIAASKETGAIVTAEDHQIHGGLGSAVAEVVVDEWHCPIKMIGVKDTFGESGKPDALYKKYGLTSDDIVKAVLEVLMLK